MRIHLDTDALIAEPDWHSLPPGDHEFSISSIVYAEYCEGLYDDDLEVSTAAAQGLLTIKNLFGYGLPFDGRAVQKYRVLCEAVNSPPGGVGRVRRRDVMVAAVAAADGAAILTHNVEKYAGLERVVTVLDASSQPRSHGRRRSLRRALKRSQEDLESDV